MKTRSPLTFVLLATALFVLPATLSAQSLDDLSWMVGNWKGPAMGGTLEERWAPADGGTMSALVDSTGPNGTNMVEVIVISEGDNGLELRLRQFEPDLTPRTPDAVVFAFESASERSITFKVVSEGAQLSKLTYSRPTDDTFQVKVGLPNGAEIPIDLKAQE